jgi:hypothetical protein
MAIVITTNTNPILGKKLSFLYQFTVDEIEYVVANYVKFDQSSCIPNFAIWNLTNNTSGIVTAPDCVAGEAYPVVSGVDLLSNGRLAVVSMGYYLELDLVNKAIAFYRAFASVITTRNVRQGTTPHVVTVGGTSHTNMWLEWCDLGGGNWDSYQLTIPTEDYYMRFPCSLQATDTAKYVYTAMYNRNCVIAVNMSTKAETQIPFVGATSVYLRQVEVGGVNKVYANADGSWYELDGIADPIARAAPTIFFHYENYDGITANWFTSETIEVDKTNIIPNASGEVSISVSGVLRTLSSVALDALNTRLFSPPHPDGYSLIQGGRYGPVYKILNDAVTILGYDNRNSYGDLWSPNHQLWWRVGYDKKVSEYLPDSAFTCTPASSETEILTTNPAYKNPSIIGLDIDHFLFPCIGIDNKMYFSTMRSKYFAWYDTTADTWGRINFVDGTKKLGAADPVVITSTLNSCEIMHNKSIMGGYFIAISSRDQDVAGGDWVGRLRLFDVLSQTITKILTITGADAEKTLVDIGILVEVGDSLTDNGHVIAVRGNLAGTDSHVWRINTNAIMPSAVVWEQAITGNAFNLVTTGTNEYCDLEIAPDGLIYLMVGTDLKTIDPATGDPPATITPDSGSLPSGCRLRWVGNNLYGYYADTNLYKVAGLIPLYSCGSSSSLPGTDSNLDTFYTDLDITYVASVDADMVSQSATDEYAIHQFKVDATGKHSVDLTWTGQSNIAPSHSTVYLQIYDHTLDSWVTAASNSLADADINFTLAPPTITPLEDYKDASEIITVRVYQEAK